MSLGKRLFIGEAAAAAPETSCPTDRADILGDGSGIALYSLDYDASDASGNYDGIPYSVDFGVDGEINWAGDFNSTGYIDTNLTMPSTTTFGFSCWFKQTSAANAHLVGDFTTSATNPRFRVQITSSGGISVGIGDGSNMTYSQHSAMTNYLNVWKHILVAVNGTSVIVYIDGTTHSSATHTNSLASGSNNLIIGAYAAGTSSYQNFNGLIDQVRFLTRGGYISSQVTTIYTETACVYTPTTDTLDYQGTNIAYYKLDGNALDETSNNYDGTEGNITYEFGRFGTAAVFNDSAITTSLNIGRTNDFTISFWVKDISDSNYGSYDYKWVAGVYNNDYIPINYNKTTGKILLSVHDGTTALGDLETPALDDNWHHIVFTQDVNVETKLYLDGVLQTSETISHASMTQRRALAFGTGFYFAQNPSNSSNDLRYRGKLDQVRIYNSALDAAAVENLYNEKQAYITKNASDPFGDGDEEAFYKFDNNTNDSTGSSNMTNRNITFSADSAFGTHSGEFNGTSSEGIISSTTTTPVDFSAEDFTISFWAKVDNFNNTGYLLSKWGNSSISDRAIIASIRPTGYEDFNVYEHDGSTYYEMTHSQSLEAQRWYHFAYTRNGSTGTVYVDGVGESFTRSNTIKQTSQDIFIGNARDNTSVFLDGHIDSMRFFSRCLDGDEVFKLYAEVIN